MKTLFTILILTLGLSNISLADVLDCHEGNSTRSNGARPDKPVIKAPNLVYPSTENLLESEQSPSRTYCSIEPSMNNEAVNVYSVVQEGTIASAAGDVSYMFNLTEGYGWVARGKETQKEWWLDKLHDSTFITCNIDEMTDLPVCVRISQGVVIVKAAGKEPEVRFALDNPNAVKVCYRIDKEPQVCASALQSFTKSKAKFIERPTLFQEPMMVRVLDKNNLAQTFEFDNRGSDTAYFLTTAVTARLLGIK